MQIIQSSVFTSNIARFGRKYYFILYARFRRKVNGLGLEESSGDVEVNKWKGN
jgi:hypothetical protein